MKKQELTTRQERKLRFAEAGILFVFILGIAIFLGVRFGNNAEEPAVAAVESPVVVDEPVARIVEPAVTESADTVAVAEVTPEPAPEPVVVTYDMAEEAYFNGEYDEATDLFAAYVETRPANAWGHYMLGLSAWKSGDAVTADAAFAAALDQKPDHFKSLVNGARVLLELERDTEAATHIATALELDPASAEARRVQARILHRQGKTDDAVAAYETILRGDLDDAWALNNLGLLLIEQERFDEALAPLARAASLRDAACIRNNLGVALERTGHYLAAAAAYEGVLELDTDHAKADASLARVSGLVEDPARDSIDLQILAADYRVADEDPLLAAALATEMDLAAATVVDQADAALAEAEIAAQETGPEPPVQKDDGEGNR
ncbi:MAG: tetratricopeptide repeat protein [bacterium]|nr:tetratricopeptide repeat protein [bacterium]